MRGGRGKCEAPGRVPKRGLAIRLVDLSEH